MVKFLLNKFHHPPIITKRQIPKQDIQALYNLIL